MNLKFFILGIYVLVTIVQISSAQDIQNGQEEEEPAPGDEQGPGEDEEIEQRRKLTNMMNSPVNVVQPNRQIEEHYQEVKKTPSNYLVPMAPEGPPPPSPPSTGGGLLGNLVDLGSNLLPLLKPLGGLLKGLLPMVKPLLGAIVKGIPLIANLLKSLQPLLGLLKTAFKCLKTLFKLLLKGLKFLVKGLKKLLNLLPVLPKILSLIPAVLEALWRVWRSIRYALLYPLRHFKRLLQRIVRVLYGIPRYLGAILRGIGHFLVSPVRILGFLFKRAFLVFNDYVIIPVARLKYFLINLFDVLLGPLNIIRNFLEELTCLFVKTPLRVLRSFMRAFFVNGILNTIRYIKTVIFEIVRFPWSRHYADMFPSLGNRHNYILPKQIICQGNTC